MFCAWKCVELCGQLCGMMGSGMASPSSPWEPSSCKVADAPDPRRWDVRLGLCPGWIPLRLNPSQRTKAECVLCSQENRKVVQRPEHRDIGAGGQGLRGGS